VFDPDKELEISTDLLVNTPLIWAVSKGYLKIIWHLLADGYSPNDKDNMGNNSVHIAAAGGDTKILKVLIDDGGSANQVNFYNNLPIAMAKNKEIRSMLVQAMETGASMTDDDIAVKHEQNMKQVSSFFRSLYSFLIWLNLSYFDLFCFGLLIN
jgi:ankyrin repeat protein